MQGIAETEENDGDGHSPRMQTDDAHNPNEDVEHETSVDVPTIEAGSFHFNHESNLLLISEYEKNLLRFRNRSIKNQNIWADIVQEFKLKKYIVTTAELDRKWRNLKKHYVLIKDNNKKTGSGKLTWPYFERFDTIYGSDASINPKTRLKQVASLESSPQSSTKKLKIINQSNADADLTERQPSSVTLPGTSGVTKQTVSTQPSKMSSNEPDEEQTCSSPKSTVIRKNKREPEWIKKILDAQNGQLQQIQLMQEEVSKSNEIQKKRNDLLEKFLEKM